MRYLLMLTIVLFPVVTLPALGQADAEEAQVQEPEYEGVFKSLDPATGMLADLERQAVRVVLQYGKFAGAKQFEEIPGKKSSVRFRYSNFPFLVVRVADPKKDPYELLSIFRMEVKKKTRILTTYNYSAWDGDRTSEAQKSKLDLKIERHGSSSFLLKPATNLVAGEYCLFYQGSVTYFCFGIDPD